MHMTFDLRKDASTGYAKFSKVLLVSSLSRWVIL